MSVALPYNFTLNAASGSWIYSPARDALPEVGWNASYTGNTTWPWWQVESNRGAGSLYYRTRTSDASVAIDFTGTALILCFSTTGPTHELTVDGNVVSTLGATNDPACAEYGSTTTLVAQVPSGPHHAELSVTSSPLTGELWFFGATITAEVQVGSGEEKIYEQMIDDQSQQWSLLPGRGKNKWDSSINANAYELSTSFICQYREASKATYVFQGASAFVLFGYAHEDSHAYTVNLDGQAFKSDTSVSGWSVGTTPLYFQSGLSPEKQYTLEVQNFNSDQPNCSDTGYHILDFRSCCVNLDALMLLGSEASLTGRPGAQTGPASSAPTSGPPAKSSSNDTVAIAAGVVAGVLGVLLIGVAAFFLWRRRKRQRNTPVQLPVSRQLNGDTLGPSLPEPYHVQPWHPPSSSGGHPSTASKTTTAASGPVAYGIGYAPRPSEKGPLPVAAATAAGTTTRTRRPSATHTGSTDGAVVNTDLSADASTGTGPPPLPAEDMERVLQYVAQHMNQQGAVSTSGNRDTLPAYRG